MSFPSELRQLATPPRPPCRQPEPDLWSRPSPPLTSHPYAKAFVCGAVTYVVATTIFAAIVMPRGVGAADEVWSRFAIAGIAAAILTGMIARRSRRNWSVVRIAVACLALFLLLTALQDGRAAAGIWQAGWMTGTTG